MSKKFVAVGFALVLAGGIFTTSLVKGEDLNVKSEKQVYFDNSRNSKIEVTLESSSGLLFGKNFGNVELQMITDATGTRYHNEKRNVTFYVENEKALILIGDKKVFEGELQKDESYKDIKALALTKNSWQWKNIITQDDLFLQPADVTVFDLSFTASVEVSASTDCADFSGGYQLTETQISISLTQDKKICTNTDAEVFIQALKEANSIAFDKDGNLVMFLKDNAGSMSFVKK